MDWLNFHHLRYFWTVAREGGLKPAAEKLHVSQPSISAQIRELEAALGEKLFRKSGRANILTDAGQIAYRYAEEIFILGRELDGAIKQRPSAKALRLHIGVADSFPKLLTNAILRPVFALPQTIQVIGSEGKAKDLIGQLASHRLDLVLTDEPAPSGLNVRTFTHLLGESGVSFCAMPALAAKLKKGFPRSLHQAPALLPTDSTGLRRSIEKWFQENGIKPHIVAEFEDASLLKIVATEGRGFLPLPSIVLEEAIARYGFALIGSTRKCTDQFFAITAERRIHHPAVSAITQSLKQPLKP